VGPRHRIQTPSALASGKNPQTPDVCRLPAARFDSRDGFPTAGSASKPLATYPIELREGALEASLQA